MKKSLTKRIFKTILAAGLTMVMLAGCAPQPGTEEGAMQEPTKTVKIATVNWADAIALTSLAEAVLKEEMGYEVETTFADVGPVFASVASGDNDVFLDAWLPVTHETYLERYGDQLDELGTIYTGARIGLVVPQYVEIDSISELPEVADKFDGKLTGIDAGAGVMEKTREAIETYGLDDFELITSSGPMMTAALQGAIEKGEWIAVTGWTPHWKFGRWDLKFLEDPEKIYGEEEYVKIVATKGYAENSPEVAEFFSNFKVSVSQVEDLMNAIEESDAEPYEAAKVWMNENIDEVRTWIPQGS